MPNYSLHSRRRRLRTRRDELVLEKSARSKNAAVVKGSWSARRRANNKKLKEDVQVLRAAPARRR